MSKLLRKVEILPVDKVKDVKPEIEIITRPHRGIRARFRRREL